MVFSIVSLYTCPVEEAKEFEWSWITFIVLRNLLIHLPMTEFWHWVLYTSNYKDSIHDKKFNPVMPEDWTRDRVFTMIGVLLLSLQECFVIHLYATGVIQPYADFWSRPIFGILYVAFLIYWGDFHFYFAHRVMHPWFSMDSKYRNIDFGRFLYRHVHSLHHKSYNPGPWSGLSMHPVEHIIYFTRQWFPLFTPFHMFHFYFSSYHASISPLIGHDGYDSPGSGSAFHYLHHAHFECNYGTPMVPLDRWFGTFQDGSKYQKKH